MKALLVIAIVGCSGSSPPSITNRGGAPASVVPAGWVAISPDEERLRCANHARDEWQVEAGGAVMKFTESAQRESDTGPPLPFTPPTPPVRGRRHVIAVSDGFLVGYDAGEWGGALWWFSPDGARSVQLGDENVHGLVAFGPDLVASIEGLSHLSLSEGNVRWVEHAPAWHGSSLTKLDAGPRTFVAAGDSLFVLTTASLLRIGADRIAVTIQPTRTSRLYPDSMAIDAAGELWIGMRQFVLRLTPASHGYRETWLVRESCVHARVADLACICAP